MSHYTNALLAERVFPNPAYYQGSSTEPTPTNNAAPSMAIVSSYPMAHHGQLAWPQYYAERPAAQPQASSSYSVSTGSSSSPSLPGHSEWQHATSPSALTSAAPVTLIPGFPQQAISAQPSPRGYQGSPESFPAHLLSSQGSFQRQTAASPEPSPYLSLCNFRDNRNRSPSSVSEYTGWDSPKSAIEEPELELEYPQPLPSTNNREDGIDQSKDLASRCSSLQASTNASSSFQTAVKIEDHEDCFIMELSGSPDMYTPGRMGGTRLSRRTAAAAHLHSLSLSQSLAPPTEVPLRATQASEEMRARMGVFRLNPFTMHSLSVNADDGMEVKDDIEWEATQPSWCGGEPHALEEEPLLFEFQLDLYGSNEDLHILRSGSEEAGSSASQELSGSRSSVELAWSGSHTHPAVACQVIGPEDENQLRSFSPGFELHPEDVDRSTDPSYDTSSRYGQDNQENQDEDRDDDQDQHSESLGEVDYTNRSEVDSSSTTTRSVHTPFTGSPHAVHAAFEHQHIPSPPLQPSVWDAVNEQYYSSEENRFPGASLLVAPKPVVELGFMGGRIPRLHATTSHPYMRRSPQYQQNHSQSHTQHSAPQLQPQGFSLLNQPTHHSLHQLYPPQQHSYLPHQSSFSQSPYQENEYHSPAHSNPTPNSMPSGLQRMDVGLSPSYMRVIRGTRSQDLEYGQDNNMYGHRRVDHDVRRYTSTSETSNESASNAIVPHYIATGVDSSVAASRRWSLPENTTGHGHSGQFLS